MPLAELPG